MPVCGECPGKFGPNFHIAVMSEYVSKFGWHLFSDLRIVDNEKRKNISLRRRDAMRANKYICIAPL